MGREILPTYTPPPSTPSCITAAISQQQLILIKRARRDAGIFTALHGMQTRSSDENSVCPSVRPSHAWIVTKRKKDLFRFIHRVSKKTSTHIIGYKLRNSCPILIIFDTKIPHII